MSLLLVGHILTVENYTKPHACCSYLKSRYKSTLVVQAIFVKFICLIKFFALRKIEAVIMGFHFT